LALGVVVTGGFEVTLVMLETLVRVVILVGPGVETEAVVVGFVWLLGRAAQKFQVSPGAQYSPLVLGSPTWPPPCAIHVTG
jgi:hypothetical protein